MHKKIESKLAPKALGPYSQAISTGDLLFVSGQLPLDPETQEMAQGGIKELTRRVLENLKAILIEGGSSLSDVVRCDIFMTDLTQFKEMNEAYAEYFNGAAPPARQTIQVAALPLGAKIEISCIASAKSQMKTSAGGA